MVSNTETRQDMNVPMIITITLLSVVLLVVIVAGVDAWFRWEFQREHEAKIAATVYPELAELRAEQQASLDTAPITIDDAMEQVVAAN